jgi:hypothetical protein
MRVAETRKTPYGIKRRRYKRPGADDLTTFEIPEAVARGIGLKVIAEAMARWKRGETQREMAAYRREFIRQRIGTKPTAIAHELGVTDARVKQIIKEINEEATKQRDTGRDARRKAPRQVHRDPADDGRDD